MFGALKKAAAMTATGVNALKCNPAVTHLVDQSTNHHATPSSRFYHSTMVDVPVESVEVAIGTNGLDKLANGDNNARQSREVPRNLRGRG